jgi:hypothetical protein
VLAVFAARTDALSTDAQALVAQRALGTAEGVHLERLGAVLGEAREGLSDATYTRVLRAVVLGRRAQGIPRNVTAAAQMLTAGSVLYLRRGIAAYRLVVSGVSLDDPLFRARVSRMLRQWAPVGVDASAVLASAQTLGTNGSALGWRL